MERANPKQLAVLLLLAWVIVGLVLTGACGQNGSNTNQIIQDITPKQALNLIQNNQDNPDFIVLDVRTIEEFSEEHIENAVNLDYYSETFRDELNGMNKDKKYLLYCRSANRSGMALDIMRELEFKEVYHMLGGIIRWKEEGLPTITSQVTAYSDEDSIPEDSVEEDYIEDPFDKDSAYADVGCG